MVSIPDWSRFRRGPPPPSPQLGRRAMTPRERYIRAMEKEAINEASRKGYFLDPSKAEIIEEFGDTHGAEDLKTGLPLAKQMWHVHHIRYTHKHMKMLGDIGMFSRIVILILDNNYLENIDELASCRNLIKLDIHSNQISVLPDAGFWAQLQNLRILIAHDNPIGRVEAIHSLVACSRLQILTLHDSPLAIKKNYRHHVVNTIWSLKALDRSVVSDEEIIEDALFTRTRFAARNKAFSVDLAPSQPKPGGTFEEELIAIRDMIRRVNKIMAHYCPVLIIQKNIRFWLTYRRYRLYVESRKWAAVTIQRAWRGYKHLRNPYEEDVEHDEYTSILGQSANTQAHPTWSSHQLSKRDSRRSSQILKTSERERTLSGGALRRGRAGKSRGLVVDIHRLHQISSEREDSLNAAAVVARAQKMSFKKVPGQVPGTRTIPAPPPVPGKKPLLYQKHFFGPVLQDSEYLPTNHRQCLPETLPETDKAYTHQPLPLISSGYRTISQPTPSDVLQHAIEVGEEVPRIGYRLEGKRTNITHMDAFEETIITRREQGQDVRDMETNFHEKLANELPRFREKKEPNIKEKFLFERMQQTMALSSLTAVQQAYRDRDLDEMRASKMQMIMMMKERRELAKERVKAYQQERRLLAIASRQDDSKGVKDSIDYNEREITKSIDKSLIQRERVKVHRKQRDAEQIFSRHFTTQQTSVSKALIRHDRQLRKDTKYQNNLEKVEAMKDMECEQQEIVKKYLQHRKMLRQTENSMSRAALDTKMLQDANDRLYEAKSRVDHLKSTRERARQFTTLPETAMTAPVLPISHPPTTAVRDIAEAIRNSRLKAGGLPNPPPTANKGVLTTVRLY